MAILIDIISQDFFLIFREMYVLCLAYGSDNAFPLKRVIIPLSWKGNCKRTTSIPRFMIWQISFFILYQIFIKLKSGEAFTSLWSCKPVKLTLKMFHLECCFCIVNKYCWDEMKCNIINSQIFKKALILRGKNESYPQWSLCQAQVD